MRGVSGGKYVSYGSLRCPWHIKCGSGKTGGAAIALYAAGTFDRNVGGRKNAGAGGKESSDDYADFIGHLTDCEECAVSLGHYTDSRYETGERRKMEQNKYRVLNRDAIKYMAITAMLLNHIANVFLESGTLLSEIFLDIGYFTAITMCYFLVEGYRYTRSKMRYGLRLLLFALISQLPFRMAFPHGAELNVIATLFVCFLILVVREKVEQPTLQVMLQLFLIVATYMGDWPYFAPLFVIMFDSWWGNWKKIWYAYGIAIAVFGILNLVSNMSFYGLPKAVLCATGSCLGMLASGVVIQFLYNGKRAKNGKTISKWFFYIFYPGHLLILASLHKIM